MKHLLLSALVLAGLSVVASAGELRPLEDTAVCLDSTTVLRDGIRRILLEPCNREETQNVRRGEKNTIYIGSLCLQAISIGPPGSKPGAESAAQVEAPAKVAPQLVYEVLAAPCTGGPGQRWTMSSDGRITSGEKLCLGVEIKDTARRVTMVTCKEKTEDRTGQRWAIYGKF
jgi:hypothetical protein